MTKQVDLTTIGRAEKVTFIDYGIENVSAKIDTGADMSSIWASKAEKVGADLYVTFFGPSSKWYSGEDVVFKHRDYSVTRVANSFGHRENRYKVKLRVRVKGRLINATFSLSARSKKLYPILIGRALLNKKFIVDVSKGDPLRREERQRERLLKKILSDAEGDL